jgi:hypothetical protein
MIVGADLVKASGEQWAWEVEFRNVLATTETMTAGVFRAIRERDQLDVTTSIKVGDPVVNGSVVRQTIHGGDAGERYMMELKGTTSLGMLWEAEQRLIVKDIP